MNFESGKFFDIYKVGEKLGHGHFAEVKHCINLDSEEEYAAKFIRVRQSLDSKSTGMNLEEIKREAQILKMLNHQNIIKLFFCYDLGKSVVLVLELVAGGELFDHISDSEKLSEEEASEFVEQILLGVQHMHERKVVHLDLKPENVMIEDLRERKIKLIDFGLAREIKTEDTIIEMQGTAEFLAPEVINYNPISYATDMWAIGVINYIMLTSVSPFSGDDQFSTFQNIVNCRLDFDEDICSDMSEMAKSFIKSLLILNPRERATANSCLKHPWIKPVEQASIFRRRSSIISRDKLQSLKQFVVYPSPPSSEITTPRSIRKCHQENDILEDSEDSWLDKSNDEDLVTPIGKDFKFELSENMCNLGISNDISNHQTLTDSSPHITNGQNEIFGLKADLVNDVKRGNFGKKEPIVDELSSSAAVKETNEYVSCHGNESNISKGESKNVNEISLIEENSHRSSVSSLEKTCSSYTRRTNAFVQSVSVDDPGSSNTNINSNSNSNLKQRFNNTIANSVRKLNSKFENITSLFDSKTKSSNSSSANDLSKRRGSLKNSLNVNSSILTTSSDRKKQLLSSFSTDRSISHESSLKLKSIPGGSVSVATSPTILKKSVFISRYMAHIESKKY